MKPIILKAYPVSETKSEIVRLQEYATKKVRELQRQTGLSASYIVSEIIRQAEVEFEEADNGEQSS